MMKLINKLNETYLKTSLIIFLIIQPIFDLKIFYNSFSTLTRVIFISLFFLYYFIKNKNTKKYILFIYPTLLIIFFLIHHINALSFYSLVPGDFNYSLINEFLYCVKMICPFMLIYSIYNANFSKEELFFIIKVIVLFISVIIIFSNLFKFSYGSYSDEILKTNFFDWFKTNTKYVYQDLASKGLFEYANQISAVLLMFLPFIIYINFETKNTLNFITLCFNVFALFLLCTKVAILGVVIVFIYTFLIYLILNHRFKNTSSLTILFIIYILLLPFNPSFSRMFERQEIIEASADLISNISIDEAEDLINNFSLSPAVQFVDADNESSKETYIESNYESQKINENFILYRYPYKYDPDFWYDILTNNNPNKSDYRYLEQAMVKRVVKINNNKFDKFLGITYTRVQNIFNIEKDFVMQYYSLGIIGLFLFIGPYFIMLCAFTIKNKLKNLSVYSLLSLITIFMIFAISYYSGNLLNSLSFTLYFALTYIIIINNKNMES